MKNENYYSDFFSRYASNTNGKNKISNELGLLFSKMSIDNLLDVGAGTGEIAIYLSKIVNRIVAVEPNIKLVKLIQQANKPNIEIYQCKIQDFEYTQKFDCILLSYFLDTIPKTEWPSILKKLKSLLKPNGLILGITYLEGCEWDVFTQYIARQINISRSGGFGRVTLHLRYYGWDVVFKKLINTQIFGTTYNDLYDNLEFFYKAKIDDYRNNKEKYIHQLKNTATTNKRANIGVKEVLYKIINFEETK